MARGAGRNGRVWGKHARTSVDSRLGEAQGEDRGATTPGLAARCNSHELGQWGADAEQQLARGVGEKVSRSLRAGLALSGVRPGVCHATGQRLRSPGSTKTPGLFSSGSSFDKRHFYSRGVAGVHPSPANRALAALPLRARCILCLAGNDERLRSAPLFLAAALGGCACARGCSLATSYDLYASAHVYLCTTSALERDDEHPVPAPTVYSPAMLLLYYRAVSLTVRSRPRPAHFAWRGYIGSFQWAPSRKLTGDGHGHGHSSLNSTQSGGQGLRCQNRRPWRGGYSHRSNKPRPSRDRVSGPVSETNDGARKSAHNGPAYSHPCSMFRGRTKRLTLGTATARQHATRSQHCSRRSRRGLDSDELASFGLLHVAPLHGCTLLRESQHCLTDVSPKQASVLENLGKLAEKRLAICSRGHPSSNLESPG